MNIMSIKYGFVILSIHFLYAQCQQKKLNALVILADDAGFQMGAYRNKICQTPNLDQLARNSLLFNKAFTSVSSCSPSRSALLTGMPAHQNGMYGLHQAENHFDSFSDVKSLPRILREHNIRTGIIGKKHVGPEEAYPFDYAQTEENNSILQVGRNITHIKLLAREFLQNYSSQPFFLYVAFHDPHRCGHTNPEYGEFCQDFGNGDEGMGLIPDWYPIYYQPSDLLDMPYYIPNSDQARNDMAAMYTAMSRLDQGVGLILKELEAVGHLNDTLIIYSSDNGIPFPNGRTNLYDSGVAEPMMISSPLQTKRRHEVTYSMASLLDIVPTLLDWYGIEAKGVQKLTGKSLLPLLDKDQYPYEDHHWESMIVNPQYPFIMFYFGITVLFAMSLGCLEAVFKKLLKPADKSNEVVFASHNLHEVTMYYPMRMIRTQRYKLIHNLNYNSPFPIDQDLFVSQTFQDILNKTKNHEPVSWFKTLKQYYYRPEWEMYDMKHDSEEMNNIAMKNSTRKIFLELSERLRKWQQDTEDPWICAPHGVFENKGLYKNNPQCLDSYNF